MLNRENALELLSIAAGTGYIDYDVDGDNVRVWDIEDEELSGEFTLERLAEVFEDFRGDANIPAVDDAYTHAEEDGQPYLGMLDVLDASYVVEHATWGEVIYG